MNTSSRLGSSMSIGRGFLFSWTVAGCGVENTFAALHEVDTFHQAPTDQVDVLFVVDDSNSMAEEQKALADGFDVFLAELDTSGTDYQIGVVSTSRDTNADSAQLIGDPPFLTPDDDTLAAFGSRVQIGVEGSDKEKGLDAAVDALRDPEFVRIGASLVVVFVSDEDDCSDDGRLDGQSALACYHQRDALVPVDEMVDRITKSKWDGETVRLGGIVGPLDGSCDEAYRSTRYADAVLKAGGALGRICDPDWTPVLRKLGVVAIGILDQFALSWPADEATIEVSVDDQPVERSDGDGWSYDWQAQFVRFHGAGVPERGATIVVEYDRAPGS